METDNLSVSDIVDLLGDDKPAVQPEKEPAVEPDELEIEAEETEPEAEEKPDEEEIKLPEEDEVDYNDIPSRKALLKAFPDIYKTFPGIEKAIYREQQYSELYPTIAAAKQSFEQVQQYQQLESSLMSGDLASVLAAVKNTDADAYSNIMGNLLPMMSKVDPQAYTNAVGGILEHTIYSMGKEAQNRQNQALWDAAEILNQFIFQRTQIQAPRAMGNGKQEPSEAEKNLAERERNFKLNQINSVSDDVTGKAERTIRSTIDKNIDPNETMTQYVRDKASEDCYRKTEELMKSDRRFMANLDALWREADSKNYNTVALDKIRKAIFNKARTVMPDVIKSVRSDALKGMRARGEDASKSNDKRPLPRQKPTESGSNRTSKKEMKPGESTADYFMRD